MKCQRCKDIEMVIIMEEALNTWFICPECKHETIRPPMVGQRFNPFRDDWL